MAFLVQQGSYPGFDGIPLAIHTVGAGRPVILLHGLFSSAQVNWVKFGTAATIAERGFLVIMPDFRVHGDSPAPHDPAAYPHDVLVRDIEALVAHLGLTDFDLGGFSLGARTTARLIATGMRPRRAVLAGMGLEGLSGWERRRDFFLEAIANRDTVKRGDPHWLSVQFMKTMKIDPVAAGLLLNTFGDLERDAITQIAMPVLVVCGDQDQDNGSAQALVDALPDGRFAAIPGTHMSSVTFPELGRAIADFLSA